MKKASSKLQCVFRSVVFFGLAAQLLVAGPVAAADILDNNFMRFGSGTENSINGLGNLQQPFYYNQASSAWRALTFGGRALDQTFGLGGDGTDEWNANGSLVASPPMDAQVIDTSGFTPTDGGAKGYGTIVSTGSITIGGQNLEITSTYELLVGKAYATITTKVKNTSGATAENLRVWVGTGDDYIGNTDSPKKEKGNLVSGAFEPITNAADRALAIQITSGAEGVLFFTKSTKANTFQGNCCFINTTTDPASSPITQTNDGSYGFYVRMNDLAVGASDQFTWYYAAGEIANLDDIIGDVFTASAGVSDIGSTTATFNATTSTDSTGYWIVVPRDAVTPSSAQIKARTNYGSVVIATSGSVAMAAGVEASFAISGLQAGTDYDLYFVSEDATPAFSSIVKKQFSTAALPPALTAPASIPTLSEWALLLLAGLMSLFGIAQVKQRKLV